MESGKPSHTGPSALPELSFKGKRREDDAPKDVTAARDGLADRSGPRGENMVMLEEIRWMVQLCVTQGEMRDEVYSQVIKQLSKNPDQQVVIPLLGAKTQS